MPKPLGGKTIAYRLKNGDTLLDIIHQYEAYNEKQTSRDIQVNNCYINCNIFHLCNFLYIFYHKIVIRGGQDTILRKKNKD